MLDLSDISEVDLEVCRLCRGVRRWRGGIGETDEE